MNDWIAKYKAVGYGDLHHLYAVLGAAAEHEDEDFTKCVALLRDEITCLKIKELFKVRDYLSRFLKKRKYKKNEPHVDETPTEEFVASEDVKDVLRATSLPNIELTTSEHYDRALLLLNAFKGVVDSIPEEALQTTMNSAESFLRTASDALPGTERMWTEELTHLEKKRPHTATECLDAVPENHQKPKTQRRNFDKSADALAEELLKGWRGEKAACAANATNAGQPNK